MMNPDISMEVLNMIEGGLFWISHVIFVMGILLIFYSRFEKFEKFVDKEIGSLKKMAFPWDFRNDSFHEWLMKKKALLGVVCILFSISVYLVLKT